MYRILRSALAESRLALVFLGAALGVVGVLLFDVIEDTYLDPRDPAARYRHDLPGWMTPEDVAAYYSLSMPDVAKIIDIAPGIGLDRGPRTMSEIASSEGMTLKELERQFHLLINLVHGERDDD